MLYDYSDVVANLFNFCEEKRKTNEPFSEEEAYELIYCIIDASFASGIQTFEYLDLNPFNIFLIKSEN